MSWVIENWFLVVAVMASVGVAIGLIYRFLGLPTEKQKAKVKEWLIWACIEAERALQSGTGQLKLREVWNLFCAVPAFLLSLITRIPDVATNGLLVNSVV